jgi:hypothetical protein
VFSRTAQHQLVVQSAQKVLEKCQLFCDASFVDVVIILETRGVVKKADSARVVLLLEISEYNSLSRNLFFAAIEMGA